VIDASTANLLRSKYVIRKFFLIFSLLLISIILLLWIIATKLPSDSSFRDVCIAFLGNLAAAVAIFILTYAFYLYVTPPGLRNSAIIPLPSAEIAEGMASIQTDALNYWFWGRGGSFLRTRTLPKLGELARQERRHITIKIVIPDPKECNSVTYMNIKKALGESADLNTLSANIVATIFAAITETLNNSFSQRSRR
jgi:hypothetical protein